MEGIVCKMENENFSRVKYSLERKVYDIKLDGKN